jgi:hypothetical protein
MQTDPDSTRRVPGFYWTRWTFQDDDEAAVREWSERYGGTWWACGSEIAEEEDDEGRLIVLSERLERPNV